MSLTEDAIKLNLKLNEAKLSVQNLMIALEKEEKKKQMYQAFINDEHLNYDKETLIRGLASIENNIKTISSIIEQDEIRIAALERDIGGIEIVLRFGKNGCAQ